MKIIQTGVLLIIINKPSSSTAQQRGKPPHCALQNIKTKRDTSISSAVPARQTYRNEEQRQIYVLKNPLGMTQFVKVGL